MRYPAISMLALSWVVVTILAPQPASSDEAVIVQLSPQTMVRLATVEEAKAAIVRKDTFTEALSTFDLQCRLKTEMQVTTEDLMKLYADNVTAWPKQDILAVTKAIEFVRTRIAAFPIRQPREILLIRTTGQEEFGAAYCRGPAIVFPASLFIQSERELQRLLAHELFHVISSHNPALRRDLYAIIGFHVCEPITLPQQLRNRAITNPDAPIHEAYIELTLSNETKVYATPVLIASAKYELAKRQSIFQWMQFKLLGIEKMDGKWRAIEQGGEPILHEPRDLESYASQIGKNTGYTIHPDEILADNFAHWVMQTENLPNPEIVDRLQQRMMISDP